MAVLLKLKVEEDYTNLTLFSLSIGFKLHFNAKRRTG
jgi:hypothetical protein